MTEAVRKVIAPRYDVAELGDVKPHVHHLVAGCRELIASLRFDATALPVDDLVFVASAAGVSLIVDIRVPDRGKQDSVEWIHIWRTLICPWDPLESNGPEYLVRWMRETIANTMAHEVDESISLDGERIFDPHRSLSTGRRATSIAVPHKPPSCTTCGTLMELRMWDRPGGPPGNGYGCPKCNPWPVPPQ